MFKYIVDHEVQLKLLEPGDAEVMFRLTNANRSYLREWMAWIDSTKSSQDSRSFIESARTRWSKGEGITAGILFRGELCGTIDHHALSRLNRHTSIGYWLGESYQGRGIMTRACRAMVSYAFDELGLGLHRVEIRAGVDNLKSRAVPERLGFTFEGVARGGQRLYGRYIDLAVYGILAEEWDLASGTGRNT
ncbi:MULTISPECIES: GNAT family protein [unclassified Paenibacillus]|uniref:GNAT family N-acetyltransferase n=1 Tax=unclassified Paenibacillus TaxID=185978 RepID=UPI001AEAA659|nr:MULTISPECIES: GNAT family protein [unclassified Paenibacillus]MBP1157401.1 ribosomal-protein-serine acetyltransferase [Paenibacillus sp. PvP091]MBP1171861.1 ribosomal-protein-serine acetyltransferase [Paenibacillus sp. PvR098]MBP2438242.1 ribosomal-protein-serine acetyltransferase [Paenibacillus sp. PvP052]